MIGYTMMAVPSDVVHSSAGLDCMQIMCKGTPDGQFDFSTSCLLLCPAVKW